MCKIWTSVSQTGSGHKRLKSNRLRLGVRQCLDAYLAKWERLGDLMVYLSDSWNLTNFFTQYFSKNNNKKYNIISQLLEEKLRLS